MDYCKFGGDDDFDGIYFWLLETEHYSVVDKQDKTLSNSSIAYFAISP